MSSIHLREDSEFDKLIIDQPPSGSFISRVKQGPVALLYFAIVAKELSKTFKYALFPLLSILTFLSTLHSFATDIKNKKNSNASFLFNMGLNVLFGVVEVASLILALLTVPASVAIAGPIAFTAMSSYAFFKAMSEFFYHAGHMLIPWWNKKTYTVDFDEHAEAFIQAGVRMLTNAVMLLCSITTFLAPYVPAIGAFFGATVTLGFQMTAYAIFGAGFVSALKEIGKSIKTKFKNTQVQSTVEQQITVSEEYLEERNFNSLNANLGDLKIKLQALHEKDEKDHVAGKDALSYQFIKRLIRDEETHLRDGLGEDASNHVKYRMLKQVEERIDSNPALKLQSLLSEYSPAELKKIKTSYFKSIGGMQKILVLSNLYCGFFQDKSVESSSSASITLTQNCNH